MAQAVDDVDYGPLFGMSAEDYYAAKGVKHSSEFIKNARGMSLYTHSWTPDGKDPKGLLFFCHGYANDSNWLMQLLAIEFVCQGYAVAAMDYECHGRSEGLQCAVRNLDLVVDDCIQFFSEFKKQPQFADLPTFLYGESMGGAIIILIFLRGDSVASLFDGAVLASPMCKIKESIRPPLVIQKSFEAMAYVFPDAPIVPSKSTIELSCRDPNKLLLATSNPRRYRGKPRLAFGLELLRVTEEIEKNMHDVTFPFFVIHGEADLVTEVEASKELHQKATSSDKTIKVYPDGWHALLAGEPEEQRGIIFQDVVKWFDERISRKLSAPS